MQNWGEDIFKVATGNEDLHQGNDVRVVNLAT
jgi:hypothetical protein